MKSVIKQRGLIALLVLYLLGCKEEEGQTLFQVQEVPITQEGVKKPNIKNTIEFISIAYSDLFGKTLDNRQLNDLATAYASFGDKKLIEDLIIKNFLKDPEVNLPSETSMRSDVQAFVTATYQKFYNRDPNEFELWHMNQEIEEDINFTPEIIYYAFMTSNEYRNF